MNDRQMHDYSDSRRGGAIGRKTVTIMLKRGGRSGQIGKEVRTLTVKRTAALADFRFDAWNPPFTTWEIKPVQSEYNEGATVYVKYCVKNTGDTKGKGSIKVKDLDSGDTVATFTTAELDPNERFKTAGSHAYVGKMPNRDWRLEWTVTP